MIHLFKYRYVVERRLASVQVVCSCVLSTVVASACVQDKGGARPA